ncbi:HEAT repeat domain-containing protein [Halonotius roseus]|uniref:HEAT repeat domain-containing protein n=1 Tax=Halonotius roseus TaxID=2511997 RepID=A0A544QML4_9EURY|nr:HEAT repeat domain-containing protein [Halonotius roseus]TQQ80105.1 HEAT repeat domain-containing protein [Halonotius roseus]
MRDPDEATDGPTDPRVHPEESPGFGAESEGLEDIEVSRDITIGEATPRELQATDIAPLVGTEAAEKITGLRSDDLVKRRRAALALGEETRAETILDALIEIGLADEDSDVRQFSVESLGELGGERAGDAAVETLSDPNPWVRSEALIALDKIDRQQHATAIEASLADDHHAVRRNAAVSLFKLRGTEMKEVLLDQTHDDSERVREWAAHLLAGIPGDDVETRLREIANDDSEPKVVRSTAARSIEEDPGAFRRQFTGGTEGATGGDPTKNRLNKKPDF